MYAPRSWTQNVNAKSVKVASNFPILPMIGDLSVTDRQTQTDTDTQTDEHHQILSSPTQKALRATRLHLIR